MADPEEIKEWLRKADEDWRVAEILLISGEELTLHHSRRSFSEDSSRPIVVSS
jgi:hypothetical protein